MQAIEQLQWLTTEGGLSASEVGRRMKTPHSTISRWLRGHYKPVPMACVLINYIYQERRQEKGLPNSN